MNGNCSLRMPPRINLPRVAFAFIVAAVEGEAVSAKTQAVPARIRAHNTSRSSAECCYGKESSMIGRSNFPHEAAVPKDQPHYPRCEMLHASSRIKKFALLHFPWDFQAGKKFSFPQ